MNEQHHSEVDVAGAYVLDALAEDEAVAFEAHLRACPECRAEVEELRQVVDILPLAVDPVEPPAGLRDRILTGVRAPEAAPPLSVLHGGAQSRSAGRWRSRLREPVTWVAGVAAAAIIGLGVWNVTLQQQEHSQLPSSVAALLAQGARSWPVAGTSVDPSVTGSLIQPKHNRDAILVLAGLPQTPSNKVYQVWLMRGNAPTSAGTFSASGSGTQVFYLIHPATGFQLTAMTVEPAPHGSAGPTTKPVLFGKLGA